MSQPPVREYRFHAAARNAKRFMAILLIITIIGSPFGIWILWRTANARLTLGPTEVIARQMLTVHVKFSEVARYGILRVPLRSGGGVAGHVARQGVGGGAFAYHLCFQSPSGQTKRFIVSTFERHEEIAQEIGRILGKQPEEMIMGGMGPSWPKAA